VSTLWLRPETWRLFPGLTPPPSPPRLLINIRFKALKRVNQHEPPIVAPPRAPAPTRPPRGFPTSFMPGGPPSAIRVPPWIVTRETRPVIHSHFVSRDADTAIGRCDVLGLPCWWGGAKMLSQVGGISDQWRASGCKTLGGERRGSEGFL